MAIHIFVGTAKGAFLLDAPTDAENPSAAEQWRVRGPFCDGWPINHAIGDETTGTIWAAGGGPFTGAGIWRSTDLGQSWTLVRLTAGEIDQWAAGEPEFARSLGWSETPPPFGDLFDQVWSLLAHNGRLYAGTRPAKLLVSDDDGDTWDLIKALSEDPAAEEWTPGGVGLTLHTILGDPDDPDRMWVAISSAGVHATDDGGATWESRNALADPDLVSTTDHPAAPRDGQTGLCVHHAELATDGRLYQQNHHGTWRSDDGGATWSDITAGLPSTFGFPIQVSPRNPDLLWTLPLNGEMAGRFPPDAAAAVWHSADGGRTWRAQRSGLPQTSCFTVLRQAMSADRAEPTGVYFGTNSGSVFASADAGETWAEIARHLPTILSVEAFETP